MTERQYLARWALEQTVNTLRKMKNYKWKPNASDPQI